MAFEVPSNNFRLELAGELYICTILDYLTLSAPIGVILRDECTVAVSSRQMRLKTGYKSTR